MNNQTLQAIAPIRWVVMGVSGCGKSEIGRQLAARMGTAYIEGDDSHTADNIAKMVAGTPLDDADRHDWLLILQSKIGAAAAAGDGLVLSCSSLKRAYRDLLRGADPALIFLHLDGPRELIAARMRARPDHYMPMSLLDSQFAALEPLAPDELGLRLDIRHPPGQLIGEIARHFGAA